MNKYEYIRINTNIYELIRELMRELIRELIRDHNPVEVNKESRTIKTPPDLPKITNKIRTAPHKMGKTAPKMS